MRNAIQIDVVDRDLDGVTITLHPGVQLTGRLSIEGRESLPAEAVCLRTASRRSRHGRLSRRFGSSPTACSPIDNVAPGDYRFRLLQGPRGASGSLGEDRARFGGEDVLTAPLRVDGQPKGRLLEVVLSPNTATLDARVIDGNQRPASGVLVIAVPDAARRNQSQAYRTATTDADGRARIDGLMPGEYITFASESVEACGTGQDPAVLQRCRRAGEPSSVFARARPRLITLSGRHRVTADRPGVSRTPSSSRIRRPWTAS